MATPSPGYSITLRVDGPPDFGATTRLAHVVAEAGAAVQALDVAESSGDHVTVDVTVHGTSEEHGEQIRAAVDAAEGFTVRHVSDRTFLLHLGGKLEVVPKVPLVHRDDLSRAYTPGVARISRAIAADVSDARRLTIKRNTVAVVTDGSAVLGLGNIGPEAALPVMEGKAALFKQFAGVDAWPVCLATQDTEEIISVVKAIAPVYAGVNLEDIAAPQCFEIERRLRDELDIPVFHDDQHGTAIVVYAALINALRIIDKEMADLRVVVSGVGAAGSAIIRLLLRAGVTDIVGVGRTGPVHRGAELPDPMRVWLAEHTNPRQVTGSLQDVLAGADVFIGVSAPGILTGDDIATMADRAIVFALANPDPEVDPVEALAHAAIVATGRSDYPNQINNVLAFPGFFRGLLDAQTTSISDAMLSAAAEAIAGCVADGELNSSFIIPSVFHPDVAPAVAQAVARVAEEER
ncbi:malate dehydrogenase [Serinicoccus sp. CUA-874]|uniref:NAD-dependent malic enzyme n=1 Tax=Serinicoccus sp. CUA-874 TaxID=1517939 RepID=UPI000965FF0E|nr:NAD-dependent malic enzyme [Serinicoccus sp. CUA-874]OLT16741.1 malate dehydrogenase [Serinicoccus sp. CUA-874]